MARRKKVESPKSDLVRIQVYSWDASQDRYLPRQEAKSRYEAGDLAIDADNGMYCLNYDHVKFSPLRPFPLPSFLLTAPRRG